MDKTLPSITLTPCTSSQIAAYGHCDKTNTLALQFFRKGENGERMPGSVYHYSNVSPEDFAAFHKSESKGTHFGATFKKDAKKYPFTKIEQPKPAHA